MGLIYIPVDRGRLYLHIPSITSLSWQLDIYRLDGQRQTGLVVTDN